MNVPPTPPRPAKQRRYPMSMVTLARRMYSDGDAWTPTQIRNYLRERYDLDVSLTTIRCWVVPGEADAQRRRNIESYQRRKDPRGGRRAADRGWTTAADRVARLKVLRDAGLSFRSCAIVLEVDTGVQLTDEQVRYLLKHENPLRTRVARNVLDRAA